MSRRMGIVGAALAFAAGGFAVQAAQAASGSQQHWINAEVQVSGKTIQLVRTKGTYDVASDTSGFLRETLSKLDQKWVRALVRFEPGYKVHVAALLGQNPSAHRIKIQGATDDDRPIGYIKARRFFVIEGEITAEEEAGGDLYYEVPVKSGGEASDPHMGFVLAKDVEVLTF